MFPALSRTWSGALIFLDLLDEEATIDVASRLAPQAHAGDVLALWGGLGVGKTVFARAFIRARGQPGMEVPSPTFTLVQVYRSVPPFAGDVYHFDLFRLNASEEALELDIEDAFASGISLIEWPDRLGAYLPHERLDVVLEDGAGPGTRRLFFYGHGHWPARLAEAGFA
jgi:tRNA threonylcarbamoyladenosine biosynthesis protein TsaE